jgi:hypothetical protein
MQELVYCLKRLSTTNVIEIPADGVVTKATLTIAYSPTSTPILTGMKIIAQRPSQQ